MLSAGTVAIQHAIDAGVRVGFGTDLLGETHPAQSKELLLRATSRRRSTCCARRPSSTPSYSARPVSSASSHPGRAADLLLVDGDPLADLGVLVGQGERIDLIVRGGEIVHDALG